MHADAARLDHPEAPRKRPVTKRLQEVTNKPFEDWKRRVAGKPQNDDASSAVGREARHVAEVHVQRDEAAAFLNADPEQPLVMAAAQPLAGDRRHVMARGLEELLRAGSEVLVELELHWPEAEPIGT